jgi:hypothetical protein
MAKKVEPDVGARLRAVKAELQLPNDQAFAELCSGTCSRVNNWLNGYNLPHVPDMIRLCERTGITLDWLYRDFAGSMDPTLALRLNRRMR